jgi:glucose-6-phosphate 1-dehydrogenase
MAEAFDVADRGGFNDLTGAVRDVVQNHMLQVLASVIADQPRIGARTNGEPPRAGSWTASGR